MKCPRCQIVGAHDCAARKRRMTPADTLDVVFAGRVTAGADDVRRAGYTSGAMLANWLRAGLVERIGVGRYVRTEVGEFHGTEGGHGRRRCGRARIDRTKTKRKEGSNDDDDDGGTR